MALSNNPIQYDENIQRHQEALHAPLPVVACEVGTTLTFRVAAVLSDLEDTHLIREWAAGRTTVRNPEAERRLRTAYEMLLLLRPLDSDAVLRSWFVGMNPTLNDDAPALVLRAGQFTDALDAAYVFAAEG